MNNHLRTFDHQLVSVHSPTNWSFLVLCTHSAIHGLLLMGFTLYQFVQPLFLNSDIWVYAYLCLFVSLSVDFMYFYFYEKIKNRRFLCWSFLFFDAIWMTVCLSAVMPILYSVLIFVYLLQIASAGLMGGYKGAFIQGIWVSILLSWVLILAQPGVHASLTMPFILNNTAFVLVAGLSGFFGQQVEHLNWSLLKAGTAIQNLSHLNERIVGSIHMGLFILDEDLHVVHSNKAAQQLLNLPTGFSCAVQDVFPKLAQHISSGQVKNSNQLETEYGQELNKKNIEIFISPFEEKEQKNDDWWTYTASKPSKETQKYLVLFQDCTHLREMEHKVREKEKFSSIGKMAAGIAHEIRNPLSSISGSIQLLDLHNRNQSENKRLMDITLSEVSRLNRIISDFLDYTVDEKSIMVDSHIETLSVNSILEELLDHVRVNSRWEHITHHFTLQAQGLIQASTDRLKQIFLNLIKNACEAMEGQPNGHLEIASFDDNEWIVVQIKDNGSGINKKELSHIFDPFYSRKGHGRRSTGLGLSIAHKLISAYGGHISFQNRQMSQAEMKEKAINSSTNTLLNSKTDKETDIQNSVSTKGTICTVRFPIHSVFVPGEMAQTKSA